ncbi:MAG: hypothetical protein JXA10_02820, partial [Anaerolineae bacterium]|nr:hypothetical protein [Anaerolineae bacterium]
AAETEADAEDVEANDEADTEDTEADETEAGAEDTEADTAETEADAEDVEANDEADTEDTEAADTETDTDAGAAADTATETAATQTWTEVGPGQMYYTANINVVVVHGPVKKDEIVASLALAATDDVPSTLEELFDAMKADLEARYEAALGETIAPEAFTGPTSVMYGGVPMIELDVTFEASVDASTGQEIPMQMSRQFLIDLGEDNLYFVQLIAQGEVDATTQADFEAWLDENAPVFAATEPADAASETDE